MDDYTPFNLVPLRLSGQDVLGRPIEYSGNCVDGVRDEFGRLVKPTRVITTCPTCGEPVEVDVTLGEPPFSPYNCLCLNCHPNSVPLADPFVNPINEGYIQASYLNRLAEAKVDATIELSEKVEVSCESEPEPEPEFEPGPDISLVELLNEPEPRPTPQPAEVDGEEEEFDDSDMVEPE